MKLAMSAAAQLPSARWLWLPLAVLVLLPLLVVTIPPLHDYPFHLARAEAIAALLGQVDHGTPYRLGSFMLPNEAMDVVTLGLTAILAPIQAGRVFLGLVQVLLLSGTVALHYALHRRVSPWPLLAAFFLYNWIFLYGFTNYLFGVGVMLWAVAAWVATAEWRWVPRLAVATQAALVLLFCHLVAFGLFAVVVGGLALHDALTGRHDGFAARLFLPGLPFLVGLVVFVVLSPTIEEARQPIAYAGWWGWKPLVAWRTLLSGQTVLDIATLGPVALLALVLLLRRRLGLAPPMLAPLLLLGATFAVMPHALFGSAYGDARLPVAVLLVAIASTDLRRMGGPAMLAWVVVLGVLLAGRSLATARGWMATQEIFARHMDAFATMPEGSVLWAATAGPYPTLAYRNAAELAMWHPPLKHVASLAGVGRDIFVPATWADPYKQPIAVPQHYRAAKQLQGDNPFKTTSSASLAEVLASIRRLREAAPQFLLLSYPARLEGALPPGATPVAAGPDFLLLRLDE